MRYTRWWIPMLAALLVSACSSDPSAPPVVPDVQTIEIDGFTATLDPSDVLTVTDNLVTCDGFDAEPVTVTEIVGRAGEAQYLLYQPSEWNAELVLFAHGWLPPSREAGVFWFPVPIGFGGTYAATVPLDLVALRDFLVCHGFALGASSFERYGLAIEEGIRDTHLLNAVARWHFDAPPAATYVVGPSLGGGITVALAERFPHAYAGALSLCGITGGSLLAMEQLGHVRVLADVYLPELFDDPPFADPALTHEQHPAFQAKLVDQAIAERNALRTMATVLLPGSDRLDPNGIGLPLLPTDPAATTALRELRSLIESLSLPLAYYTMSIDDVRERSGGIPFDNQDVDYTGIGWDAAKNADLNEQVYRHDADPATQAYWTDYYQPTGDLSIPVVAVHTTHDPGVPVSHLWAYTEKVEAAGAADRLLTWQIERYGHCTFTPEEVQAAFLGLTAWAGNGALPRLPPTP